MKRTTPADVLPYVRCKCGDRYDVHQFDQFAVKMPCTSVTRIYEYTDSRRVQKTEVPCKCEDYSS